MLLLVGRACIPDDRAGPRIVGSDSVPDAAAVGMCALNRATGVLEGRVVEVTSVRGAGGGARYRVRSLGNPAAEYLLAAEIVQVVRCP